MNEYNHCNILYHYHCREAKTIKDRENAWDTIERLAIQNPHVSKLTSPHKAFKQSMLSQLSPISSTDTVDCNNTTGNTSSGVPTMDEIGSQAKVYCY